ncbi:DUF1642 domain-containing protein [Enterococcus gallinarum]|uniref:DUF1642 domain-containing protein n=1 Tax=Enterococcus gallinarum TaxID=1353 RepID=UPI0018A90ED7|nr:DUF1642 domain-containing protein [Enterococcus gallinarum]
MNKQELIEKVAKARSNAQSELNRILSYRSKDTDYDRGRRNAYAEVETWIEDLDKLQKVVVKKFVAEWFEEHKNSLNDSLWDLTIQTNENSQNKDKKLTAFEKWFIDFEYSYEYLIRMKNGYEVEKEPLYQVKIPTVNWDECSSELVTEYAYLIWDITSDEYKLSASNKDYKSWRASLTESEIKSIDERYWAFAVPVEEVK